jgi:signal transduction histidine kinase
MSVQDAPRSTRKRSHALDTRLHGRWLLLARGTWITLVVITLTIFFASFPVYITQLQTPCAGTALACALPQQLTPELVGALKGMGLSAGNYAAYIVSLTLVSVVVYLVVSTLIIWRRPDDRMALLVALMLVTFGPLAVTYSVSASPSPWRVPNACLIFLALSLFVLVFLLFPSGQFVPHWMRWTSVLFLAGLVPTAFVAPLMPNTLVEQLIFLVALGEVATVVCIQLYRYRHVSSPLERQQTKWVVFGLAVPVTVDVIVSVPYLLFPVLAEGSSLYPLAHNVVVPFIPLLIPLSFAFAMLRYRLWDIDILINRTLVYATLTAIVVGVYVLVVSILSTLLHTFGNFLIALLATGLIAVLFQPLRARLQRGVNRLMYGERDDPYAVLSRLASRLETTLAPESVHPTIVETVAQALKLPYVAIALKQDDEFITAASYGHPPQDNPVILPLVYQTETIGQLRLSPRAPGEAFTAADRRLLEDIAHQAGVAAHAVRLTNDLQRSRERLVTAREEERRRLRRDLHDGLGATLAALHLQTGAIRTLMRHDLAAADVELLDLQAEIRSAIADIRRLVYALRPPTLDELGLVGAIRQYTAQYDLPGTPNESDRFLRVTVEAPEHLPALPAAVEVAAYRIVQEALTNVARHAHARTCTIRLAITNEFLMEISDDGVGFRPESGAGVGLLSMRERAAESGGSCLVESAPGLGTRILVYLPLAKE